MKKNISHAIGIGAALLILGVGTANATLMFSDVNVTSNSVTFTVDGDMSGYTSIGSNTLFSIQYKGDLWAGLSTPASNSWSSSVFDTHDFDHQGNTGIWASEWGYTWSRYDSSLATAVATNRTVTVEFLEDLLNPYATAGELIFVVGIGNSLYPSLTTVLESFSFSNDVETVPEPSAIALFGLGLLGLLFTGRKKASQQ